MSRREMDDALNTRFVPALRRIGFKGSLPHFRRPGDGKVDLLTVQFDRHGGGFVVEISRCGIDGITTHWGKSIPATKVTAHDLLPRQRHRLGQPAPGLDGCWFTFDDGTPPMTVAESLCTYLDEAERWWAAS